MSPLVIKSAGANTVLVIKQIKQKISTKVLLGKPFRTCLHFNPLSAHVVRDADVACSGCSASHRRNYYKMFLKEEKIIAHAK